MVVGFQCISVSFYCLVYIFNPANGLWQLKYIIWWHNMLTPTKEDVCQYKHAQ